MKVKYKLVSIPRSDGQKGPPGGVTDGKEYVVAENFLHSDKFSVINDDNKIARYSKFRFEITDETPVRSLCEEYNTLTSPLRKRIKELEALVASQAATINNLSTKVEPLE